MSDFRKDDVPPRRMHQRRGFPVDLVIMDESGPFMTLDDAERWARGYAATPGKERRREVATLLAKYDQLRAMERRARELAEVGNMSQVRAARYILGEAS